MHFIGESCTFWGAFMSPWSREIGVILLALLTASLAAAMPMEAFFAFGMVSQGFKAVFLAIPVLIAFAHAVILGLPAYLLGRLLDTVTLWYSAIAGLVIGCIPTAIYVWPVHPEWANASSIDNGVKTLDHGVVTTAGWMQYLSGVAMMGTFGVIGGIAAWVVWRYFHRPFNQATTTP